MRTKPSSADFEVIAKIFDWGWAGFGIAAFYFFVRAAEYGEPWLYFILSIVGAIVSLWFARQLDKKTEPLDDKDLTSTYSGSELLEIERRRGVIADYGEFLMRHSEAGVIWDASILPHPKDEILNAMYREFLREEDESVRETIRCNAVTITSFQEDVGAEPLYVMGMSNDEYEYASKNDDMSELARKLAAASNTPKADRYQLFNKIARKEALLNLATLDAARQKPQKKRTHIEN